MVRNGSRWVPKVQFKETPGEKEFQVQSFQSSPQVCNISCSQRAALSQLGLRLGLRHHWEETHEAKVNQSTVKDEEHCEITREMRPPRPQVFDESRNH